MGRSGPFSPVFLTHSLAMGRPPGGRPPGENCPRWGPFSLSTLQVRQAPSGAGPAKAGVHTPCISSKCPGSTGMARAPASAAGVSPVSVPKRGLVVGSTKVSGPLVTGTRPSKQSQALAIYKLVIKPQKCCRPVCRSWRFGCSWPPCQRRRSSVNGNSLLAGTWMVAGGTFTTPGVWPMRVKRDRRRLSAV